MHRFNSNNGKIMNYLAVILHCHNVSFVYITWHLMWIFSLFSNPVFSYHISQTFFVKLKWIWKFINESKTYKTTLLILLVVKRNKIFLRHKFELCWFPCKRLVLSCLSQDLRSAFCKFSLNNRSIYWKLSRARYHYQPK